MGAAGLGAVAGSTLLSSVAGAADSCTTLIPQETAGPYPGDGSNDVNVLTQDGLVRSEIRSSFGSYSGTADGVVTTIEITMINANTCNPLAGAAIYLWHCTQDGDYSLYNSNVMNENFLRGVQISDSNGKVTFTTIFPCCYSGRWPHLHFEVYPDVASITSASNAIATSQFAIPAAASNEVYNNAIGYNSSINNLAGISLASDNVFRDGAGLQMMTAVG